MRNEAREPLRGLADHNQTMQERQHGSGNFPPAQNAEIAQKLSARAKAAKLVNHLKRCIRYSGNHSYAIFTKDDVTSLIEF
jgi:hypothetical protein